MNASISSNVIKKAVDAKDSPGTQRIIKRPVAEALSAARRIIAEAEATASAIRERAEQSAREMLDAAYQQGFEAALFELNHHLIDAKERRDTAIIDAECDLLQLAVKLAEKIIGREIDNDKTTIAEIVATALQTVRQHETLTVYINPNDAATVHACRERLNLAGRARFLSIVADPRVHPNGCLIESQSGTIDAQLDTQLRVLEQALLARASTPEQKEQR